MEERERVSTVYIVIGSVGENLCVRVLTRPKPMQDKEYVVHPAAILYRREKKRTGKKKKEKKRARIIGYRYRRNFVYSEGRSSPRQYCIRASQCRKPQRQRAAVPP